ncbi:hypothetical protein EVG20_g6345 [Dentipellis fragilis]|uniref:Uncharacterized protein n=1 Tax=Dentipellis fragilis TaxID=205917 RepID=A0A4Y9YND0_9AGAM|nr:hypothetical protein EVG20_g6345 [Dentipellis fragilis]
MPAKTRGRMIYVSRPEAAAVGQVEICHIHCVTEKQLLETISSQIQRHKPDRQRAQSALYVSAPRRASPPAEARQIEIHALQGICEVRIQRWRGAGPTVGAPGMGGKRKRKVVRAKS